MLQLPSGRAYESFIPYYNKNWKLLNSIKPASGIIIVTESSISRNSTFQLEWPLNCIWALYANLIWLPQIDGVQILKTWCQQGCYQYFILLM